MLGWSGRYQKARHPSARGGRPWVQPRHVCTQNAQPTTGGAWLLIGGGKEVGPMQAQRCASQWLEKVSGRCAIRRRELRPRERGQRNAIASQQTSSRKSHCQPSRPCTPSSRSTPYARILPTALETAPDTKNTAFLAPSSCTQRTQRRVTEHGMLESVAFQSSKQKGARLPSRAAGQLASGL